MPGLNYSYEDYATPLFDSVASVATKTTSPYTWQHSIGNGSNRLLIVLVAVQGATQPTATAVTFNGVAMTKVRSDQGSNGGATHLNETSIWFLHNPPIGTYTVSVTSTVPTSPDLSGVSLSYFGAKQVSTADAASGSAGATAGPRTATLTTATDKAFVVGVGHYMSDSAAQPNAFSTETFRKSQPMSINLGGMIVAFDGGQPVDKAGTARSMTFYGRVASATDFLTTISIASFAPHIADNNAMLAAMNSAQMSNLAADDGDYFIQTGSECVISEFKKVWTNNTDNISAIWNGRTTFSPAISPVLLQIYNVSTAAWETIDKETVVPADTDFTLQATQTANVANYYDSRLTVSFRVYQQVI